MSVRIRLQRHGRRKRPYYHIVAADQRSKRDGRIIERIGSYDPTRNPAFIDLNFDKALNWVQKGAQATDTCRAILSYKGVLMRDHLNRGVTKGAMTQDQADAKFKKWLEEKENLIESKRDRISKESQEARDKALKAEKEIREKREAEIAERQAEERKAAEDERAEKEAAEAPEPKAEEPKAEEPKAKAEAEEPKAEEPKAKAEEPKAEESKAEEGGEEKKDEKSE